MRRRLNELKGRRRIRQSDCGTTTTARADRAKPKQAKAGVNEKHIKQKTQKLTAQKKTKIVSQDKANDIVEFILTQTIFEYDPRKTEKAEGLTVGSAGLTISPRHNFDKYYIKTYT